MKYYSPSNQGFYDTSIKKEIPADCIFISDDEYNSLFANQAAGIPIVFSGNTVCNMPYVPNDTDIKEEAIRKAKKYLSDTDFYFTVDKFSQLNQNRIAELTNLREAARVVIRGYQDEVPKQND